MQPLARQTDQQRSGAISAAFLIPDLCSSRAVFVMVLLAELLVLVHTLAASSPAHFDWNVFARASFFMQWTVLCSAGLLCPLRQFFSHLGIAAATICSLLVVVSVTALSSFAVMEFYPTLGYNREGTWWLLRNVMVALVLAGIALRYFYLQQQLRLREISELQARLDSLQARIRPHFLFNTMNSIASLIATRPSEAEQAVEDLSELFRHSLREGEQLATVADELHLCRLYLGIEQLRLGDRLSVAWQVDPKVEVQAMPGLLLQPLVENAIYHGIAQLPEGGTVRIEVGVIDERIHVCVHNPVPARAPQSQGHQMALTNIEQRLFGLYGSAASLEVSRPTGQYCVDLYYPQERAQ